MFEYEKNDDNTVGGFREANKLNKQWAVTERETVDKVDVDAQNLFEGQTHVGKYFSQ